MFQKTLKNYMSTIFAMSDLCDNSIKKNLPQMGLRNECVDRGHLEFLPPYFGAYPTKVIVVFIV